jgi:hypothetical protein
MSWDFAGLHRRQRLTTAELEASVAVFTDEPDPDRDQTGDYIDLVNHLWELADGLDGIRDELILTAARLVDRG